MNINQYNSLKEAKELIGEVINLLEEYNKNNTKDSFDEEIIKEAKELQEEFLNF